MAIELLVREQFVPPFNNVRKGCDSLKIEPIQGSSAPERVVKQIVKSLETGEVKPGDKLPT